MQYEDFDSLKQVSLIGFGGGAVSGEGKGYGFGKITESEACELMDKAYDSGINLFDTAPIYGFGESERRMGLTFKNKREKVYLVSKSGVHWHDNKRVNMTNDPKITQTMIEQSLRTLSTEYIDLYMIHWPDQNVDIRKPLEVIVKAKDQGKIKVIGLCNTNASDLKLANEVTNIPVIQVQCNFFERGNLDLIHEVKKQKIKIMSWGTFDQGILSGRVTIDRKFDDEDARKSAPWWDKDKVREKVPKVKILQRILEKKQFTLQSFALSYNYAQGINQCLVGARNLDQLSSLLKAKDNLIPENTLKEIISEYESLL